MKICNYCGTVCPDNSPRCSACGAPFDISTFHNEQKVSPVQADSQIIGNHSRNYHWQIILPLIVIALCFVIHQVTKKGMTDSNPGTSITSKQISSYETPIIKPPVYNSVIDLTTLIPYYKSNNYFEVVSGITDTLGNKYNTGIRSYADHIGGRWSGGETYWVWDIGGKYNKLTATGIIRNEDKGASINLSGLVRIYGDGRLLYEKNNITSNTKPYYINVNISGVRDLKLEMYGQSSELGWSGIDTVLVDIMLQ